MDFEPIISNQDFELLKSLVEKSVDSYGSTYNFKEKSIGFEFFVLENIFNLQEDEIIESITDSIFQTKMGRDANPDRGIDAIKIDEENNLVHLFNFKYNDKEIKNVIDSHYQGNEVDKILSFISDLYHKDQESFSGNSVNSLLRERIEEIWKLNGKGKTFQYKIHLISNTFKPLILHEHQRFSSALEKYRGEVSFDYILVNKIINKIVQRTEKVHGKFRALNKNFFDKSDFGRRALIIEVSSLDLLRIVSTDKDVREDADCENIRILNSSIEESAFSDNVRVYLKQKTVVNQNIKVTALDEKEMEKIFFYNNGITITCNKITYQGERNPVIHLDDLQIVNGGQTIHALRSAFEQKQDAFEKITLLCKIYETSDSDFKNKIAEYTNSQNPVSDRDIRSIDTIQIKLEKDFYILGFYYARKKFQHADKEKMLRVDSEKLGQALMSYTLEMPAEAKNRKSLIFGEKYNELFNTELLAKDALNILNLYGAIESKKISSKGVRPYLLHATYYIIFFIKKIAAIKNVKADISLYDDAVRFLDIIIEKERKKLKEDYSDAVFFKSNRPKEYLSEL